MANVFLISDTHFSHVGVTQFLREDGVTKLRPWDNISDMDDALIANWNSVVKPFDKVYHLGDVAISHKALPLVMPRLNGKKVLIKGNHDIFGLKYYLPHFYDIRAFHKLDNFVLTHVPIHPLNMARFKGNVHGHMHEHTIPDDPRYKSVCVEQIDYTPVELSVIQQYYHNIV